MDDKLTIEEVVAFLAAKLGILQTDADAFVCSFLALIEEGLIRDKYVRIKSLGTFKLIDTDLNEGRIVFIPETSVRDAVNKPFSHFVAVELKDGVSFDDVEEGLASIPEGSVRVSDEVECKEKSEVEKEKDTDSSGISDSGEITEKTEVPDIVQCEETKSETGKTRIHWYMLAAILFVGIVIGGGIVWGVISYKSESVKVAEIEDRTVKMKPTDIVSENSLDKGRCLGIEEQKKDTAEVKSNQKTIDSIIKATTEDRNEIKFLSDEVAYKISGTIEEYTISKGSTLSKVANHYYKNRKLWPYIVMHNKDIIQDPNNVPIGTVLRIPLLTPVE